MRSTREGGSATPLAWFLFLSLFLGTRPPPCRGGLEAADVMLLGRACGGRSGAGECVHEKGMGVENMEPEAGRRSLQQSPDDRYISYRFLNRDAVPCTTPGVPYYSCHGLPSANPHTRGCLTVTRCRNGYP